MNDQAMMPCPEVQEANRLADHAGQSVELIQVDCPDMFDIACDELRWIVTRIAEIDQMRLALTRPLDESKKRIMDHFRVPRKRLEQYEAVLRSRVTAWRTHVRQEEEASARERERAAAQEQRTIRLAHQEADQRHRQAQAAERKALDRVAEAASGDGAAAAAAAQAAVRTSQAAASLDEADEALRMADVAPPVHAVAMAASGSSTGVSGRTTWKVRITDFKALVIEAAKQAQAGDDFLLAYLLPNDKALSASAKAMKDRLVITGVRVYCDEGLAIRRK